MNNEKYHQSQNEQGQTEREELPNPAPSFDEHMRNIEKSHRKTFEEKAKEKGLEDLSEISNDFFSKSIDDWIKKAKFWGPIRVEENSYKED